MSATKERVPLQVYLDRPLAIRLAQVAEQRGLRRSELVRSILTDALPQSVPPDEDPLLQIVGMGTGGKTDAADHHDRYLQLLVGRGIRGEGSSSAPPLGSPGVSPTSSLMRRWQLRSAWPPPTMEPTPSAVGTPGPPSAILLDSSRIPQIMDGK
ncbi:MAG: ribbon-helix-helix domain-containing protein [Thermaerobacter sp.]|nr:ribbon-helix-helix domain-containing protein [Thermaerobacter sp.]